MEIDTIATHDAETMRRMLDSGEPLSSTAAQFGYTSGEAAELLEYAENNTQIPVGWWKEVTQ